MIRHVVVLRSPLRPLAGTLLIGALLPVQVGSSTSALVDALTASAMRPVPTVPQRDPERSDSVWVPDRSVAVPGTSGVVQVPGHWERRISERQVYVPPLVVVDPADGTARVVPPGVREPAESRVGP